MENIHQSMGENEGLNGALGFDAPPNLQSTFNRSQFDLLSLSSQLSTDLGPSSEFGLMPSLARP
jgi:hypothetical protein